VARSVPADPRRLGRRHRHPHRRSPPPPRLQFRGRVLRSADSQTQGPLSLSKTCFSLSLSKASNLFSVYG